MSTMSAGLRKGSSDSDGKARPGQDRTGRVIIWHLTVTGLQSYKQQGGFKAHMDSSVDG